MIVQMCWKQISVSHYYYYYVTIRLSSFRKPKLLIQLGKLIWSFNLHSVSSQEYTLSVSSMQQLGKREEQSATVLPWQCRRPRDNIWIFEDAERMFRHKHHCDGVQRVRHLQ